jgi:hypothetical protein
MRALAACAEYEDFLGNEWYHADVPMHLRAHLRCVLLRRWKKQVEDYNDDTLNSMAAGWHVTPADVRQARQSAICMLKQEEEKASKVAAQAMEQG